MTQVWTEPDDGKADGAAARAEARAARLERERDRLEHRERNLRERPERPDFLGLRFHRHERAITESWGLRLIEPKAIEQIEKLQADVDRLAALNEARLGRIVREHDSPGPGAPRLVSCTAGPALGFGPSVSLDGNGDPSGSLVFGLPKVLPSLGPEFSYGAATGPDGSKEQTVSADFGANAPFGLARVAVGVNANLDRRFGSGVYLQGRMLGVACKVEVSAQATARAWDKAMEGVRQVYDEALREIGYPERP